MPVYCKSVEEIVANFDKMPDDSIVPDKAAAELLASAPRRWCAPTGLRRFS